MRTGLVIPHDGEAAVSEECCRHSLTPVVPPAASSAEPSRRVIRSSRARGEILFDDAEHLCSRHRGVVTAEDLRDRELGMRFIVPR